uniref:Microfibril-associated glycoprotein 4-like n=1 Tax=Mastacembelus armatus TaxID=205130 RepID=A0A3Q3LN34_9TELE
MTLNLKLITFYILLMLVALALLLAPLLSSCRGFSQPVDCSELHQQDKNMQSGVYTIYPLGERSAVQVYCDMDSLGGEWTVFQRRTDGSVNFYRPWDHYKFGFGNAAGEYWLGLDNIYYLTHQKKYELLVDMKDFDGQQVFARYSSFSISGECDGYQLTVTGFTDGGAGDALSSHIGFKFSTFDKDQDTWPNNCAKSFLGAFWYGQCHRTNPNGVYRWGADSTLFAVGVCWSPWKGIDYSLKTISMKIRPVQ